MCLLEEPLVPMTTLNFPSKFSKDHFQRMAKDTTDMQQEPCCIPIQLCPMTVLIGRAPAGQSQCKTLHPLREKRGIMGCEQSKGASSWLLLQTTSEDETIFYHVIRCNGCHM
ncbi:hypothetical protein GOODEAATRI_018982 [Goodea atripinnis]|uniref:Uncharacterized protein n=1 Tax=Goodea atripinnis TaxID=208336 RepID=A0ABV0P631_9TELE